MTKTDVIGILFAHTKTHGHQFHLLRSGNLNRHDVNGRFPKVLAPTLVVVTVVIISKANRIHVSINPLRLRNIQICTLKALKLGNIHRIHNLFSCRFDAILAHKSEPGEGNLLGSIGNHILDGGCGGLPIGFGTCGSGFQS